MELIPIQISDTESDFIILTHVPRVPKKGEMIGIWFENKDKEQEFGYFEVLSIATDFNENGKFLLVDLEISII